MNIQEEMQEAAEVSTPGNAPPNTPGEWLRQAREQAGLTMQQVAAGLRLDVRVIAAIEDNHFKELGAPVYAKGYIKKYARMVGMAEDEMLQRYAAFGDIAVLRDPIPAATGSIREPPKLLPSWALWAVAVMVLIAIAITLLQLRPSDVVTVTQASVAASSGTSAGESAAWAPLGDLAARDASSSTPGAGATASSTEANAGSAQLALQLTFSGGDSWVEVYDANNRPVLYEMGRDASERQVSGVPPLRLVFGSATHVSVQVNGRELNVPSSRVDANVARFAINAAGAIE